RDRGVFRIFGGDEFGGFGQRHHGVAADVGSAAAGGLGWHRYRSCRESHWLHESAPPATWNRRAFARGSVTPRVDTWILVGCEVQYRPSRPMVEAGALRDYLCHRRAHAVVLNSMSFTTTSGVARACLPCPCCLAIAVRLRCLLGKNH